MKSLVWMFVFIAAALMAQQPQPGLPHPALEANKPATATTPAPTKVAPVIPVEVREEFYKAEIASIQASEQANQAVQEASARRDEFKAAVAKAVKSCGAGYGSVTQEQGTGNLVCVATPPTPAPGPAK